MRVHAGHVAHHDTELDALIRPQSGVDIAELLIGPDLGVEHLIARAIAATASMLNDAAAHTFRRCEERARIPIVAERGQLHGLDEVTAVIAAAARHGHALCAGARAVCDPRAERVLLSIEVLMHPAEDAVIERNRVPLLLRTGVVDVRDARIHRSG